MAEEKNTLFGWSFRRKAAEDKKKPVSFAPDNEDGAFEISPTVGYFGQYMDLQGDKFQNDKDLIFNFYCNSILMFKSGDNISEICCKKSLSVIKIAIALI